MPLQIQFGLADAICESVVDSFVCLLLVCFLIFFLSLCVACVLLFLIVLSDAFVCLFVRCMSACCSSCIDAIVVILSNTVALDY